MLKKILAVAALLAVSTVGVARAQDYPPAENSLILSVSVTAAGTTITLTAQTFETGALVTFTIFSDPVVLGTASADSDGVARLTATIPAGLEAGSHRIEATGTGSTGVPLTVTAGVVVTKGGTTVPSGSNLPRTGSDDTVPVAAVGVGTLAVGGLLVLLARRRRSARAAA